MVRLNFKTACCEYECKKPTEWPEHISGATFDCPKCGKELIFTDNDGSNEDFHEHLHRETGGRWPKDGANTGYIEF
jgi:transcription initiation factor IIE alpha subunit